MADQKRQPAAHSGAAAPPAGKTSHLQLGKAATSEMKVEEAGRHPAPGCSPKHVVEVKPAANR